MFVNNPVNKAWCLAATGFGAELLYILLGEGQMRNRSQPGGPVGLATKQVSGVVISVRHGEV